MQNDHKFTPGPYRVVIESTCFGAWPRIVADCVDPETGEPWELEVGQTPSCYVETAQARESDEMPGTYNEKPHRFELLSEGEESLATANLFAAAPDLLAALEAIESKMSDLYRLANEVGINDADGFYLGHSHDIIKQAQEAIAKALGTLQE